MSVAVITASASVVVAVLAFLLGQWGQVRAERRKARLDRVNAQLRELYGPLKALADANETVWLALRDAGLPDAPVRRSGAALSGPDHDKWRAWTAHALMPVNRRMRDLILQHADLIVETEPPEPLVTFCAHVAAFEVAAALEESGGVQVRTLIRHPGSRLNGYLDAAFTRLKNEQARLVPGA